MHLEKPSAAKLQSDERQITGAESVASVASSQARFIANQKAKHMKKLLELEPEPTSSDVHPGLHSDVFEKIRGIPTGDYGVGNSARKSESQFNFDAKDAKKLSKMANMNQKQLDDTFNKNFKTLFNGTEKFQPLIDENSVFPKLVQLQQLSNTKQNTQKTIKLPKSKKLRSNTISQFKTEAQSRLRKGSATIKEEEPLMQAYHSAHKRIKDNINTMENSARINLNATVTSDMMNLHSTQNAFLPGTTQNQYMKKEDQILDATRSYPEMNNDLKMDNAGINFEAKLTNGSYSFIDGDKATMQRTQLSKSSTTDFQNMIHFPSVQNSSGIGFMEKSSALQNNYNAMKYNKLKSDRMVANNVLQMSRTVNNIVDANINGVSNFKAGMFEANKKKIKGIHHKLMKKKRVEVEKDITYLQKFLSIKYKEIYLDQSEQAINHNQHFNDMNVINQNMMEILSNVCNFKMDLALTLEKVVECYNSVFIQQYQTFHEMHFAKNEKIEAELENLRQKQAELDKEKEKTLENQEFCQKYITAKDNELDQMRKQLKVLEDQTQQLKDIQLKDREESNQQLLAYEQKKAELTRRPSFDKDYDRNKRISLKQMKNKAQLMDEELLPEFKDALEVANTRIEDRNELVDKLFVTVKQMLSNKMRDAKVQTDVACWNGAITFDYEKSTNKSAHSPVVSDKKESTFEDKVNQIAAKRGINLKEEDDSENERDGSMIQIEGQDVQNGEDLTIDPNQNATVIDQQSYEGKSGPICENCKSPILVQSTNLKTPNSSNVKSSAIRRGSEKSSLTPAALKARPLEGFIPFDSLDMPIQHYQQTGRQIGIIQPNRLLQLHQLLNETCDNIAARIMLEKQEDTSLITSTQTQWRIPLRVIAFCANRLGEIELKKDEFAKNYELMSWSKFKELMFDIYDHRILHAPEINNSMNSSYCTLNEHLLVFFVESHRLRSKTEKKLVDLLINLRYYYQHWERAKMFAQNMEFVYIPKSTKMIRNENNKVDKHNDFKTFRQPHATLLDVDVSACDVFCQEFFLHAYSLLSADRKRFLESSEGQTYLNQKFHDKVAARVVTLIRGSGGDIQKWNLKVRRLQKRMKNKAGQEGVYLDFDLLMSLLMDEYRSARTLMNKDLERGFARLSPRGKNQGLELDTFLEIVQSSQPTDAAKSSFTLENPFLRWPGRISQVRAYIYAIAASEKNDNIVNLSTFLAACSRFAIEAPTPTLTQKLALYGNNYEIQKILDEAIEESQKKLKWDPLQHTQNTMGLKLKDIGGNDKIKPPSDSNDEEESESDDLSIFGAPIKFEANGNELPRLKDQMQQKLKIGTLSSQKNDQIVKLQLENPANPSEIGPNLMLGGVKLKIQSLKNKRYEKSGSKEEQKKLMDSQEGFEYPYEDDPVKRLVNALQGNDKKVHAEIKQIFSDKQILVPSLETTAAVFSQHINVLQELRYTIDRLKQAYFAQMDKRKVWQRIDQILDVLDVGTKYLDFPKEGINKLNRTITAEFETAMKLSQFQKLETQKSKKLNKMNSTDSGMESSLEDPGAVQEINSPENAERPSNISSPTQKQRGSNNESIEIRLSKAKQNPLDNIKEADDEEDDQDGQIKM